MIFWFTTTDLLLNRNQKKNLLYFCLKNYNNTVQSFEMTGTFNLAIFVIVNIDS